MIVKKPYAFLIKNFRLIHGLLFIILVYLSIKTLPIYNFFSSYASTKTYQVVDNLASNYLNIWMFVLCIVVILISLLIYYLLSLKKKNNKSYMFMFLFYISLLIFYLYIYSTFNGLEKSALPIESITVYSEICLMSLIPQFVFCFLVIGRVLGFNLNQFDFKNDLKELEIDSSDNEEVELTLGTDTYKIKRTFRKMMRLLKYFILENKMFVVCSASIVVVVIVFSFLSKLRVYNVTYSTNSNLNSGSLKVKINGTYMTNRDIYNNVISYNSTYIVISVNLKNNLQKDYFVSREMFNLEVGNKDYNPLFSSEEKFRDFGEPFNDVELRKNEGKDFVVAFEIPNSEVRSDYILRIVDFSKSSTNSKDRYKRIIIKPNNMDETNNTIFNFGDSVDLKDSILKNYVLVIKSFDIKDKFKENFNKVINGERIISKYVVTPNDKLGSKAVVRLETEFEKTDSTSYMSKTIKYPADLFDYYGIIKYRVEGENKESKLKKITTNYNIDTLSYLEVPSEVLNANRIELDILIRGYRYSILLKDN